MAARELVFDILAIDRASRVFEKVGGSAEVMGAKTSSGARVLSEALLAAAAVVSGIGVESIKMAGNFEAAVVRLHTSAGETKGNLGMVSQGMLDMAGKVGFTAQQLAEGMYIVESAGHHGADGLNVLRAGAQGARTEGADLGTVLDATTTIMRDFGARAGDAATITGKMIAATSVGKTNFQDLAGAMSAVMPKAAILHMNFGEIIADLASMTAHGMSAEQSAQNMSDALKHLAGPTLAQSKIMADYGINAHDVSQNLSKRGLAGTMQYLSDTIMSQMGPAGSQLKTVFNQSKLAAQDAKLMFDAMSPSLQQMARNYQDGKISMHDWTVGLKNLDAPGANLLKQWAVQENAAKGFSRTIRSGGDAAKTYAAALQGVTGDQASMSVAMMLSGDNAQFVNDNIAKVARTMKAADGTVAGFADQQATLNGKMQDLKGATSALMVELGQKLMPAAKGAADQLIRLIGWMSGHQGAVITFGATIVGIGISLVGASVATKVYKVAQMEAATAQWAFNVAQAFGNTTLGVWLGLMGLGAVEKLGAMATALKESAAAQWLLNVALDANPIGLIILAIGGLVLAFVSAYQHSEAFRDGVTRVLDVLKIAFFGLAWAAVGYFQLLGNVWMQVVEVLVHGAATAFGWVPGLGPKLRDAASAVDHFKDSANASLNRIRNNLKVSLDTSVAQLAYDKLVANMQKPVTVPVFLQTNYTGGSVNVAGVGRVNVGMRAGGGPVDAGSPYIVGERGPELIIPRQSGHVIDAAGTQAMSKKGSGAALHIENYYEAKAPAGQVAADLMFRMAHS